MTELRRSDAQNRKWRALLSDISRCKPEGRKLTPPQWQMLLFAGWDHDRRFADLQLMEGLEGRPAVPVNGYSTSLLTVRDMADLITFALEYGDRNAVGWSGGDFEAKSDPVLKQHGRTERVVETPCRSGGKLHRFGVGPDWGCLDCGALEAPVAHGRFNCAGKYLMPRLSRDPLMRAKR